LIKNGVIEEYEENGKYKYRLTANGEKAYKKKLTSQENRSKDGKRK
jgi:predicted transcriptional regulator